MTLFEHMTILTSHSYKSGALAMLVNTPVASLQLWLFAQRSRTMILFNNLMQNCTNHNKFSHWSTAAHFYRVCLCHPKTQLL